MQQHKITIQHCGSTLGHFPLEAGTHLPSLHLFGGHHDHPGVLLEHHAPEVTDGVLQAALRGDVALLHLGAVALLVLLRLRRHERTRAQKQKRSVPLRVPAIYTSTVTRYHAQNG